MNGMIFAAGLGTRLRPLTNDRPKALVELKGKTLLERVIERMREVKVERLVINVHHFAHLLEKELASEIKTKALGLEKASGESKLRYATVPAAEVRVGCLSNKQEAILLKREDYIEKIANGIYNAIVSSYETYLTEEH